MSLSSLSPVSQQRVPGLTKTTPLSVEAVADLHHRIDTIDQQIVALEAQIALLRRARKPLSARLAHAQMRGDDMRAPITTDAEHGLASQGSVIFFAERANGDIKIGVTNQVLPARLQKLAVEVRGEVRLLGTLRSVAPDASYTEAKTQHKALMEQFAAYRRDRKSGSKGGSLPEWFLRASPLMQ